jgi:HD-like signal output (HDOD) protein
VIPADTDCGCRASLGFNLMLLFMLSVLLVAGCGIAAVPVLRKPARASAHVGAPAAAAQTMARQAAAALELPAELEDLPEPPILEAAPIQILDRTEIFKRLMELELGVPELGEHLPEHEAIVATALTAIGNAATQGKYAPRRPNLLPQLMRVVNDEDSSRRELVALIARDPSLVGSLLKMANSAFYRVSASPVESIERAVVMLGSDGLRSLIATALVQPIFETSMAGAFPRFPQVVWEHALLSAHAAIPHAALVERVDQFAAELLCLVTGLAEIVLFRAALDYYASSAKRKQQQPSAVVMASLLASQSATFAWHIGANWELSELMLGALEEQMVSTEPTTALGRSLRFGRSAGALAVLRTNKRIDDATARQSLPDGGMSAAHLKCMWKRLLDKPEESAATGRMVRRR